MLQNPKLREYINETSDYQDHIVFKSNKTFTRLAEIPFRQDFFQLGYIDIPIEQKIDREMIKYPLGHWCK